MKLKNTTLLLIFLIAFISIWSYPVYKINENFEGLQVGTANENNPKFTTREMVPKEHVYYREPQKIKLPDYMVVRHSDGSYIRLADNDGNTIWKSTHLEELPNPFMMGAPLPVKFNENEYPISVRPNYQFDGIVRDRVTKDLILKKASGTEIPLPQSLKKLLLTYSWDYAKNLWLFEGITWGKVNYFTFALVNENGEIITQHTYKWEDMNGIGLYYVSPSAKTMFFRYSTLSEKYHYLLLSPKGNIIKDLPDPHFDNEPTCRFCPQATDYAILNSLGPNKYILDLRNGEIIAEIDCDMIGLGQADSTLYAIAVGKKAAFVDVLKGKVIQDLSDFPEIHGYVDYFGDKAILSADAKDVWFRGENDTIDSTLHLSRK